MNTEMMTSQKSQISIQEAYIKIALLIVISMMLVGFVWPSLSLLLKIYQTEDDYSHGFMVPLLSVYATVKILKETNTNIFRPSWLGLPTLILGVVMVLLGYWYYIALFPAGLGYGFALGSGLLLCVIGGYLFFGGLSTLRIFFFPIIYLIFAIPFPKSLTLPLTLGLRNYVSEISENVIRSIGITVFREGNILYLATTSLGVEDACSGIRSFWVLMAGAAALAFILKIKPIKAIFLCFMTLPISVMANILRIVLTAFTASYFGTEYATGWRHELWGLSTFAFGLIMMIVIAIVLAPSQETIIHHKEGDEEIGKKPKNYFPKLFLFTQLKTMQLFLLSLLLTLGASAKQIISHHYDSRDLDRHIKRKQLANFPDRIGSYSKLYDEELYDRHLDLLQPNDYIIRHYGFNDMAVELRIVYWEPIKYRRGERRHGLDNHIPDVCYPAWGYKRLSTNNDEIAIGDPSSIKAFLRRFYKPDDEECVLFWYVGEGNLLTKGDLHKRFKLLIDSWKQSFLTHGAQYVVSIVVPVKNSYDDSQNTAIQFAKALRPILPEFGIK